MSDPARTSNHVLSYLASADFRLLQPHLVATDLPLRRQLEVRRKPVEQVYFIESGIASVVADSGRPIEIGLIGREGMTGLAVVLCSNEPAAHETFIQLAGHGFQVSSNNLRAAIAKSTSLHHSLLRYAYSFLLQVSETAMANGRSKVEERLARWLLLADDRTDDNELTLTHEFLALMLGVRRSGVTVALQALVGTGLISHRRGVIVLLDRDGFGGERKWSICPASPELGQCPFLTKLCIA